MNRGSGETIGAKIHIPSPLENSGERHSNRSINLRSPVHWLIRSGDAGESQLRYFEGPSGPKPDKRRRPEKKQSRADLDRCIFRSRRRRAGWFFADVRPAVLGIFRAEAPNQWRDAATAV